MRMDPNRLYYRHARAIIQDKSRFPGRDHRTEIRWLGGIAYYGNSIDRVDVDGLNEGKDDDLLSPNSLYRDYVDWGVIKADQAEVEIIPF